MSAIGTSPTENVKAWSEEETKRAFDLHREGMTFVEVGAALGRTKGSIAGRLHRVYGITGDGRGKGHNRQSRPRKPKAFKAAVSDLPEPTPLLVSIDDLASKMCRQPYGDGPFRFCGHKVKEGSSYCPYHHQINWRPINKDWQSLGDVAARIVAKTRVAK